LTRPVEKHGCFSPGGWKGPGFRSRQTESIFENLTYRKWMGTKGDLSIAILALFSRRIRASKPRSRPKPSSPGTATVNVSSFSGCEQDRGRRNSMRSWAVLDCGILRDKRNTSVRGSLELAQRKGNITLTRLSGKDVAWRLPKNMTVGGTPPGDEDVAGQRRWNSARARS
jgi:hypothetical protein